MSAPRTPRIERLVGQFTRAEFVAMLVRSGAGEEWAEKQADVRYGSRESIATQQLELEALEDKHVAEGVKRLRALGAAVYDHHGVKRHAKVTPGEPDVLFFFPTRRLFGWWEAKAEWGRQSSAQQDFQRYCEAVGAPYVLGGVDALTAWLVFERVCTINPDGSLEPVPYQEA